jgi:hypothetical protein
MPKRSRKPVKPITEKLRSADNELREQLRHIDLEKFDKLLEKAVGRPVKALPEHR